jgi:tRNA threonylcarbamoyladenosine modification (KEOPS) complex Cgi121 subunit
MKKNYKAFSTQIRECNKNDNLIKVKVGESIELICIKYRKVCSSIVCKKERITDEE